jgi:uncharacterized protein DUF6496
MLVELRRPGRPHGAVTAVDGKTVTRLNPATRVTRPATNCGPGGYEKGARCALIGGGSGCFIARTIIGETAMAKSKRKYSPSVGSDVAREMRRFERGTARSGKGGKGGKVKSRKQAIAIALSEARKEGKRVPKKK